MRKKQTYIYTLIAVAIVILAGFILNIPQIKTSTMSILGQVSNPWIAVAAAISAFIFMGNKNYWLINAGTAIVVAILIQYLVIGHGIGLVAILYKATAFLVIVYILNLIRLIFGK